MVRRERYNVKRQISMTTRKPALDELGDQIFEFQAAGMIGFVRTVISFGAVWRHYVMRLLLGHCGTAEKQ